MKTPSPVDLLFADMEKLSPGDDSLSLYVLRSLPQHRFELVVDAGCGAGRQTMVLASELGTPIQAVDSYQPFLNRLKWRAKEKGLAHLVQLHCMDMKDIPSVFPTSDLLWATAVAPSASAMKTSAPLRIPLSKSTGGPGRAHRLDDTGQRVERARSTPSTWRPPWLETTIAVDAVRRRRGGRRRGAGSP